MACVCEGQRTALKRWSFPSPLGYGVVRLDGKYLCVQLDFKRCPCSLSSTPAQHKPQTLLWIQQHTHGDRHLESPGSVTSCDMQAFLETSLPQSPHVPPTSGQVWEEGTLRPDPASCPHSQNDTRNISDVCPGTDLRVSLGSWLSPKRALHSSRVSVPGNGSAIPQVDRWTS